MRVPPVLLERLGRLGDEDRALVCLLVQIEDVLERENWEGRSTLADAPSNFFQETN